MLSNCFLHFFFKCNLYRYVWVVDEGEVVKFDGDFAQYRSELVAEIAHELDDEE
jgi:hypothetical protein